MNYVEARKKADEQNALPDHQYKSYHPRKKSEPLMLTLERKNGDVAWYYGGMMACSPEIASQFPVATKEELDADDWEVVEIDCSDW